MSYILGGGNFVGCFSYIGNTSGSLALPSGALGYWVSSDYQASPNPVVKNRQTLAAVSQNLLRITTRNIGLYWTIGGATWTNAFATGPSGLTTACRYQASAGAGSEQSAQLVAGTYTLAVNAKSNTAGTQTFKLADTITGSGPVLTATTSWQRFTRTFSPGSAFDPQIFDGGSGCDILFDNVELYSGSSDLGPQTLGGHLYLGKNFSTQVPSGGVGGYLDFGAVSSSLGYVSFDGTTSASAFTFLAIFKKTGNNANIQDNFMDDFQFANQLYFMNDFSGNQFRSLFGGTSEASIVIGTLGVSDLSGLGFVATGRRCDGSNIDYFYNDSLIFRDALVPSSYSFQDILVGCRGNAGAGFTLPGQLAAMALWPRALSNAEYLTALSVLKAAVAASSISLPTTRVYVAEGDSITFGFGTTNGGYPTLYRPLASPLVCGSSYAASGDRLSDLQARAATVDLAVANKAAGEKYILSVDIGSNDVALGYTGGSQSAFLTQYAAYLDARRAAGWYVVLCTLISRSDNPGTGNDAALATINTTLDTWGGGVHADAIADFSANAHFTAGSGAFSNTTYYQADGVHPTDTGQSVLEGILAPVVNAV